MNTLIKLFSSVVIFSFLIACSDGSGDTSSSSTQPVIKVAPTAVATDDFSADENTSVSLDGGESLDSDGSIVSYVWTQTSGSPTVEVIDGNQVVASFIAPDIDIDTSLTFKLTVTDDDNQISTDSVKVNILRINQKPVANAPAKISAVGNDLISLDGSESADPDGSIISYSWEQISGSPSIVTNQFSQSTATFIVPNVNTEFVFELTVTDNEGATDSTTIKLTTTQQVIINQSPISSVADLINTTGNYNVILNGSASKDSDGSISGYAWTQIFGSRVQISNANQAIAAFTAPNITSQLIFQLTVTDNNGATNSDSITVNIQKATSLPDVPDNVPPTVDAGQNQSVDEQSNVSLSAAYSDTDGSVVSVSWAQTGGNPVTIQNANIANTSFIAPTLADNASPIQLTFAIIVTDNDNSSTSDSVTITVNTVEDDNVPPMVDAGPNQSVDEQANVSLSATYSDTDGSIVSGSWAQTGGIAVTIQNANNANASFIAPALADNDSPIQLTFAVIVTDNENSSTSDSVTIIVNTVEDNNVAPTISINSPANNTEFEENSSIAFSAAAYDTEDGDLSANITWSSNIDGNLGSGTNINSILTIGTHLIMASIVDSGNLTSTATVEITIIQTEQPISAITDIDLNINTVAEYAAIGSNTGITALATDLGDTVTYRLLDDANGRFAIDANTGIVTVADGSQLEASNAVSHYIEIISESTDSSFSTLSVEIILSNDGCPVEPDQLSYATYTVSWDTIQDEDLTGYEVYYGTSENLDKSNALGSFYVDGNISRSLFTPGDFNLMTCQHTYLAVASVGFRPESTLSEIQNIVVE